MKSFGFVNLLGNCIGLVLMLLGLVFIVGGPLVASSLTRGVDESASGLRVASGAIRTATGGVSNSSAIIEDVRLSLVASSEITSGTAEVIESTIVVLDNIKIIMPLLASDMSSMPPMVRNLMPNNNFDEVASRTNEVSDDLGYLNTRLAVLSSEVSVTGETINELAEAVHGVEEDLLSAEGSFGDAADNMDQIAESLESNSFTSIMVLILVGAGLLFFLSGLYLILTGAKINKLVRERV